MYTGGKLDLFCPEGDQGSYTQKFLLPARGLLQFEGNLYIKGDAVTPGDALKLPQLCPAGVSSYFDDSSSSLPSYDYDISYNTGGNLTFGIKNIHEIKGEEEIHSCTANTKQACIHYSIPNGLNPIYLTKCDENEIKLDPDLAKTADFMHLSFKVKFDCTGSHLESYPASTQYPYYGLIGDLNDDGTPVPDWNTVDGLTVAYIHYEPETVAPVLEPGFCGDGTCNEAETCSSCTTDCGCAAGETCDTDDPISDEIGCVVSETLEICDNKLDDDDDGFIDCADGDCSETDACYRVVSGTVLSGDGEPLKNVYVLLATRKVGATTSFSVIGNTFTDEYGEYEIDYSSNDPGVVYGDIEAILNVELRDKDDRLRIFWDDKKAQSIYLVETKPFKLPKKEPVDINFKKGQSNLVYDTALKPYDTHWDASKIYYDAERAITFIQKDLGYDFSGPGNSLPIYILIYSSRTKSAFYSYGGTGKEYIAMSPKYSKRTNSQCPENCVWHELFHATQHNKYGASFVTMRPAVDENHAGFKNTKTGDSFKEGFAEFWPNIISMKLDGDTNGIYGNLWRMEMNYNPWMNWGDYEEFAFATMLWDLVDDNPDGEQLSLYYQDLWDMLMSKPYTTIGQVYDDLKKKWPEYSSEIDKVFVAHGLFKDTNEGNGKYDLNEPFWDKLRAGDEKPNGIWEADEAYIDIGTPAGENMSRPYQVYTIGVDEIGTASNYLRPQRENKPLAEGSFVKIDAPEDALYKVSYTFTDPSLNYETYGIMGDEPGYVYVEVAPDEYGMTATITIDNYESSDSVTVTNDDYYSEETMQNGYMKTSVITTGAKKTDYCNNNNYCEDSEVTSCGDCSVITPSGGAGTTGTPGTSTGTTPATPGTSQNTNINTLPDIDPFLIIGAVGGLIFLVILILIIKRLRRPKQPSQQVYYPQQPQQGNVIDIR